MRAFPSITPIPRRSLALAALAASILSLMSAPALAVAQDGSAADPRAIILLESDLEERTGPAEGQFITSARGIWLPCDTVVTGSSPLMIVNIDERGWLIQQVSTVFPDEASAIEAVAAARQALTSERLSQGCTSPNDVLVFEIQTAHDAPVSVGDEMVSATGRGIIDGESGPLDGPMSFHVIRDGSIVTELMVRATDEVRFGNVIMVETAVLESLAALLAAPRALPEAQATLDWATASAPTANAAADRVTSFAQAFDADRTSNATRRAGRSLKAALRAHLEWLADNPLPPVSDGFGARYRAIAEAVDELTRCGRPARCNRVIDSTWTPALQAGEGSNRMRDLASVVSQVASLPEATASAPSSPTPASAIPPSPSASPPPSEVPAPPAA